ncbi:MAG TPA: TonB family protein [Lacunisphaera sp.]|jgi:protein TonB
MSQTATTSAPTPLRFSESSVAPVAQPAPFVALFVEDRADSPINFAQISTLVLWSACLLVGVLGFILPYSRPHPPAIAPAPIVVEKLEVELTKDPLPPAALPADPLSMPPLPSAVVEPQISPAVAVAEPSAVAFAVPVEGPTVVVTADQAAHARPATVPVSSSASSSSPQTLVFGEGEGRQPAPFYPERSAQLGQEGTVDVRLTVGTDGRVIETVVASPCKWPLLNEAAERTVRHRWRFSRGPLRVYQVAIHFALVR